MGQLDNRSHEVNETSWEKPMPVTILIRSAWRRFLIDAVATAAVSLLAVLLSTTPAETAQKCFLLVAVVETNPGSPRLYQTGKKHAPVHTHGSDRSQRRPKR